MPIPSGLIIYNPLFSFFYCLTLEIAENSLETREKPMHTPSSPARQGCLSPNEHYWQGCLNHLRAARLRRDIAAEIPLHMAPVIAAYLASNNEETCHQLRAVTIPMTNESMGTLHPFIHTQQEN
jgi:hypothetical protein